MTGMFITLRSPVIIWIVTFIFFISSTLFLNSVTERGTGKWLILLAAGTLDTHIMMAVTTMLLVLKAIFKTCEETECINDCPG